MKKITEDQMVAVFLQSELDSTRFGENVSTILRDMGVTESLVTSPHFNDEKENELRKKILTKHRGYSTREDLFAHFPHTVDWYQTSLPKELLPNLRYIEFSYWTEITGGSRRVKDAIDTIKAGRQVFNQSNEPFHNAAKAVKQGTLFPPLILVTKDSLADAVILEGHLRATAYVLELNSAPDEIPVILGKAKDMDKWTE
ncbi:MAG TPA: hypothetical protein VG935_01400 [Patescibacteria group bacterium]|nr:hypothetical protein [Patescibacteria group bacterium]